MNEAGGHRRKICSLLLRQILDQLFSDQGMVGCRPDKSWPEETGLKGLGRICTDKSAGGNAICLDAGIRPCKYHSQLRANGGQLSVGSVHASQMLERNLLRNYAVNWLRNSPSLAVPLNCGMGSSFLNALVNAFDKLHIVRAENSGYSVSK
jgi:hypothetical protein